MDVDIKGHYDAIPHDRLVALVREHIADRMLASQLGYVITYDDVEISSGRLVEDFRPIRTSIAWKIPFAPPNNHTP